MEGTKVQNLRKSPRVVRFLEAGRGARICPVTLILLDGASHALTVSCRINLSDCL